MTWRRLRVIIQGLPVESRTITAIRNAMTPEDLAAQAEESEPDKGRWSQVEQLIAAVLDSNRRLEYILIAANSDGKRKLPDPPEPLARPGATPAKSRKRLTEANASRLFRLINGSSQETG